MYIFAGFLSSNQVNYMTLAEVLSESLFIEFNENENTFLEEEEYEALVEAKKVSPLDYKRHWEEWPLSEKHYSKKTGNRLYGRWVYDHRENAGATYGDGKIVHHHNHDKHDNSKSNLSKISQSEHCKIDPNARKHTGCKIKGCNGEHFAQGFCQKHYMQRFRKGKYGHYNKDNNYSKEER